MIHPMMRAMILAALRMGIIPGPDRELYGPPGGGVPRRPGPFYRVPIPGAPREGMGRPRVDRGAPRDFGTSGRYGQALRENRMRPRQAGYRTRRREQPPLTWWGRRFIGPGEGIEEGPGTRARVPRRREKEYRGPKRGGLSYAGG